MLEVAICKSLPNLGLEVDFSLENGILVVYGESGAGKTTLLRSIAGLVLPDSGRINLNGRAFYSSHEKVNLPARLRNIGYVFQEYALFPHMTVKENVLYGVGGCKGGDNRYRMSVLEVLEMLKITGLQERYPAQLSGGEKQRVALARALMTEPDLLLLDEPLSALDSGTRTQLRKELKSLQREWNIPFLVVTHSHSELRFLADHTLLMVKGKTFYQVAQTGRQVSNGNLVLDVRPEEG